MREVPPNESVLGFCLSCIRVRWLATVEREDERGNPYGICRSCAVDSDPPAE